MPSEAVLTYPGIENLISATIPRSHGVVPDLITLEIAPQERPWRRSGTLTLRYDNSVISLPDCLVDQTHFSFDDRGLIWQVKAWDFRWKWRNGLDTNTEAYGGMLTGRYNIRLPDGPIDRLDPLTEKPLVDLMWKCLYKMSFPNFKGVKILGTVPRIFPEVYWNYSNPATELLKLCDMVGYRIVPQFDGSVWLVPQSKGNDGVTTATMPTGWPVYQDQITVDPPEVPDNLVFVAGSSRFQFTLPLEAVGDDVDGLVKPITDLSFKPTGDEWKKGDLINFTHIPLIQDMSKWYNLPNPRELAKASVYRKYRIRVLKGDGSPFVGEYGGMGRRVKSKAIYIPGCPCIVKDVRQILPLGSELLEPVKTKEGWLTTTPVIIWGQFARGSANNVSLPAGAPADAIPPMLTRGRDPVTGALGDPQESTVLQPEDFQVDFETGIVTINGPTNGRIYRYANTQNGFVTGTSYVEPARLWMRGTCQVKEWGVWVPVSVEVKQSPPAGMKRIDAGNAYIQDREIFLRTQPKYNADKISLDSISDNWEAVQKEAKLRLGAEMKKLQELRPANTRFVGWYPIKLNGGIHQVVYTLGQSGAYMDVSLHNEFWVQVVSYEERRFLLKAAEERTDARQKALLDMIREKDQPFSRLSGVSRGGR